VQDVKQVRIIGHRGCNLAPENTLEAFEAAKKAGASMIETDLRACGDGTIVLFHDDTVDRVTDVSGRLSDFTYEELRKLRVEKRGIIPSLDDLLGFAKETNLDLNLEIKESDLEHEIVSLLRRHAYQGELIVSSFNDGVLTSFREQAEMMGIRASIASLIAWPLSIEDFRDAVDESIIDGLHPRFDQVDERFVRSVRDMGYFLNVWTATTEDEIVIALKCSPDGIITDRPDFLQRMKLSD